MQSGERASVTATLLLAVLVTSCGGASAQSGGVGGGAFSPGRMPAGGEWTGVYYSDWGRLEMQQTGETVVGEFRSDTKRGRISGTTNGNILNFRFTQNDDTIPGRSRVFQGSGQFRYYIDEFGDHKIEGTWGYHGNVSDGGPWNASRSRQTNFQFLSAGGARISREEGDTIGEEPTPAPEETPAEQPPPDEDDLGDL